MEKFLLLNRLLLATFLLLIPTTASQVWAVQRDDPVLQKRAQPSAKSYSVALELIKNAFQEDLQDRSRAGRLKTARKLIDIAPEENDFDVRFAILDQARELAVQNGSFSIAWDAIQQIDSEYQIDVRKTVFDAVKVSLKKMRDINALSQSLPAFFDVVENANRVDDFEFSSDVLDLVNRTARRTRDAMIVKQIDSKFQQVVELKRLSEGCEKALEKLNSNPQDDKSRIVAGNYLCFVRKDMTGGLALLAGISEKDSDLARAVSAQLKLDETPQSQAQAGALWFEVSNSDDSLVGSRQREHAAALLESALKTATGLLKKDIERQLIRVNAAIAADQGEARAADMEYILSRSWNVTLPDNNRSMLNIKFDANGGLSYQRVNGGTLNAKWKFEKNSIVVNDHSSIPFYFYVNNGQVVMSLIHKKTGRVVSTYVCEIVN